MSIARNIAEWLTGETKKGPIELATQAEVDAGTDTERSVTADTMRNTHLTGMLLDVQIFTSNGTWTKPAGAKRVLVECLGGGGGAGGMSTSANWSLACGGGGGAYARGLFLASGWGATVAVVVGAGGAGGASGNNDGADGGASTFNGTSSPYVSGGGGAKGRGAGTEAIGSGGAPGTPAVVGEITSTELRLQGGYAGGGSVTNNMVVSMSGGAGAGPHGAPATSGNSSLSGSINGAAGAANGGGGSSAASHITTTSRSGGAGSKGYVMVRTYG